MDFSGCRLCEPGNSSWRERDTDTHMVEFMEGSMFSPDPSPLLEEDWITCSPDLSFEDRNISNHTPLGDSDETTVGLIDTTPQQCSTSDEFAPPVCKPQSAFAQKAWDFLATMPRVTVHNLLGMTKDPDDKCILALPSDWDDMVARGAAQSKQRMAPPPPPPPLASSRFALLVPPPCHLAITTAFVWPAAYSVAMPITTTAWPVQKPATTMIPHQPKLATLTTLSTATATGHRKRVKEWMTSIEDAEGVENNTNEPELKKRCMRVNPDIVISLGECIHA